MIRNLLNRLKPNNNINDPFINRLRSLVIGEGMLKPGNIVLMEHAIKHMPNHGSVIEIGSYGGLSANLLVYLLTKHQKAHLLYTCDAWIYEGYTDHKDCVTQTHIDGRPDVLRSDYSAYMKRAFIQSTQLLSAHNLPFAFHMHSHTFFDSWKNNKTETDVFGRKQPLGGTISFAYIDGGHSYEVAKKDVEQVTQHLALHGFMLLDDSADNEHFGSALLMKELKKDPRFKVIAKNPNYLIQKVR